MFSTPPANAAVFEMRPPRLRSLLFDELWNHTPIRLLGIRTGKLLDEDAPVQMTLFDSGYLEAKSEKQQKLDAALDQIKSRYGENAVIRGSFFPEKEEP